MTGNCKSVLFAFHRWVAAKPGSRKLLPLSKSIWTCNVDNATGCGSIIPYHHRAALTTYLPRLSLKYNLQIKHRSLSYKADTPYISDEYPPLPEYRSDPEPQKKEVYIIRAKGLPWSCTAGDLLQFFSECRVRDGLKGIHLTVNQHGKPNGQAFIEMEHEDDVSKALEMHKQYLGPRYIEVYEVTEGDAEAILKNSVQLPAKDGVIRLRGLPYSCTEADIITFFSGLDVVNDGITFVKDRKGRNKGEAYVQFVSHEIAEKALHKDREVMGNRYVEVFPSQKSEIQRSTEPTSGQTNPPSLPKRSDSTSQSKPRAEPTTIQSLHYIHVRGLPFHASGEDIVEFFSPLPLSKILMEYGPDGRPSGEADVFFTCHKDAVSGMARDKAYMQERYLELFLNSPSVED